MQALQGQFGHRLWRSSVIVNVHPTVLLSRTVQSMMTIAKAALGRLIVVCPLSLLLSGRLSNGGELEGYVGTQGAKALLSGLVLGAF